MSHAGVWQGRMVTSVSAQRYGTHVRSLPACASPAATSERAADAQLPEPVLPTLKHFSNLLYW